MPGCIRNVTGITGCPKGGRVTLVVVSKMVKCRKVLAMLKLQRKVCPRLEFQLGRADGFSFITNVRRRCMWPYISSYMHTPQQPKPSSTCVVLLIMCNVDNNNENGLFVLPDAGQKLQSFAGWKIRCSRNIMGRLTVRWGAAHPCGSPNMLYVEVLRLGTSLTSRH
jgi:hypothetical protein